MKVISDVNMRTSDLQPKVASINISLMNHSDTDSGFNDCAVPFSFCFFGFMVKFPHLFFSLKLQKTKPDCCWKCDVDVGVAEWKISMWFHRQTREMKS